MVPGGVTRCLAELALASNAPVGLKSQALNTLTPFLLSSIPNQTLLSTLTLSPLVAINADEEHPNGGFVRLPQRPAVVALITAVVEGDSAGGRGLRGRAAGVNMFEVNPTYLTVLTLQAFVNGNDDARIGILSSMFSPPQDNPNSDFPDQPQSAGSLILAGLLELPSAGAEFDPYRPLFSCLLLAHLVRNSELAKKLARDITCPTADGESAIADDEDKVTLVQSIVGNLMMASREQTECVNRAAKDGKVAGSTEEEDWTRVMVGYLVLLCAWLWDSPKTVKEFLSESANLQVVGFSDRSSLTPAHPTHHPNHRNRSPGPRTERFPPRCMLRVQPRAWRDHSVCRYPRDITDFYRATLHPILHSRIGPDQFVSRMARLREDPRFRAVQPDAFETEGTETAPQPHDEVDEADEGLELWFDWAFVDFWKNHYCELVLWCDMLISRHHSEINRGGSRCRTRIGG